MGSMRIQESESLNEFDPALEPDEDSYETDPVLFARMATNYGFIFQLDAAATEENKICKQFLDDAMHREWTSFGAKVDVWCNPPHSLNEEFIKRADAQHQKHNINICMIIPTNCQSMQTWHDLIENETRVITENHPLLKRPKFFKRGRKTEHNSRNAYRVIIWRKI